MTSEMSVAIVQFFFIDRMENISLLGEKFAVYVQ